MRRSAIRKPRSADGMLIRKVQGEDRPYISDMIEAAGNLTGEERLCAVELLDIYLNDPFQKDYFFLAASDDRGLLAGYICYGPTPLTEGVYDMYWIVVDPGHRREGVGERLLAGAGEILRKEGARMLVAETSGLASYEPARRFYLKNGFTQDARIKDFYKPGDDKFIYVKRF